MTEASAMDLDELQSVRDRERQTDKLQQLRTSFYADAGEFIQQLREKRQRAADRAEDPFDAPEVNRLSDEIDTAEQTVEAIYEKRVGKIVKAASFAAADLPAEVDGTTAEEEKLFDSLVDDIKTNRRHVLDVLAGDAESSAIEADTGGTDATDHPADEAGSSWRMDTPDQSSADESNASATDAQSSGVDAADLMGSSEEATDESVDTSESTDGESTSLTPESEQTDSEESHPVRNDGGTSTETTDRATLRITDDVGEILGVDQRAYDLAEDDVVTLPSANANPLVERDAATRLD